MLLEHYFRNFHYYVKSFLFIFTFFKWVSFFPTIV